MFELILFICVTVAAAICGFNIGRRKRSAGARAANEAGTGNNNRAEQSIAELRQTASGLEQTASGLRRTNQEAAEIIGKMENVHARIRGISPSPDSNIATVK